MRVLRFTDASYIRRPVRKVLVRMQATDVLPRRIVVQIMGVRTSGLHCSPLSLDLGRGICEVSTCSEERGENHPQDGMSSGRRP